MNFDHIEDFQRLVQPDNWRCSCGEQPSLDPAWRWAGDHWQHSHGDGTGHYAAEWIGDEPREEKPTRG